MRDSRVHLPTRSARLTCSIAFFVVVISAIAGSAVSSGDLTSTVKGLKAAQQHKVQAAGTRSQGGSVVSAAGAPVAAPPAGAPAAGAVAAPATTPTMSMDAPIQGGLTAHQEQALSARLLRTHQSAGLAARSASWTPAMGRSAVARARSWLGMPYSWAGGSSTGPTLGRCDPGTGGDLDCHVVGFDCSGLMTYAWGAYLALPHLADSQRFAGAFHPAVDQLLPGDLVFFAGYLPDGTGHVAIYAGHGMVIEAPNSGSVVRQSPLSEVMASDGAYRGAVRPMTGQTPALLPLRAPVSTAGGKVTLHGAHLAGVDTVHLGRVTVRRFLQHSDSTIVFRAPAHSRGLTALTVSTSWQAQSAPVALTFVQPHRATPAAPVAKTAPSSHAAPVTTSGSTTSGTKTAPTSPTAPSSPTSAPGTPSTDPATSSAPQSPSNATAQSSTTGSDPTN